VPNLALLALFKACLDAAASFLLPAFLGEFLMPHTLISVIS